MESQELQAFKHIQLSAFLSYLITHSLHQCRKRVGGLGRFLEDGVTAPCSAVQALTWQRLSQQLLAHLLLPLSGFHLRVGADIAAAHLEEDEFSS